MLHQAILLIPCCIVCVYLFCLSSLATKSLDIVLITKFFVFFFDFLQFKWAALLKAVAHFSMIGKTMLV